MQSVEELIKCPTCKETLEYCSGEEQIPAHLYCPECLDAGYDEEGEKIFDMD